MSKVIELTEENFDEVVMNTYLPVMVDFWAEWCGPCKMTASIIEALADQYESTVIVGKVNVDEQPTLSEKFGIQSIPTTLYFKDADVVGDIKGVGTKSSFESMLEKHLR